MKLFPILITALIFAAGCSSTRITHIMTGTARGAVDSDNVKVYSSMPNGAQSIALISVTDPKHHDQDGMDSALHRLKDEAASMGANGVVITTQFSTENTGAVLSGNAVFVP
jgi:uncharacterized protein YbjQ (UPF0145 family)